MGNASAGRLRQMVSEPETHGPPRVSESPDIGCQLARACCFLGEDSQPSSWSGSREPRGVEGESHCHGFLSAWGSPSPGALPLFSPVFHGSTEMFLSGCQSLGLLGDMEGADWSFDCCLLSNRLKNWQLLSMKN